MRKRSILIFLLFWSLAAVAQRASVRPINLTCEYLSNPLGLDELHPRFSWTLQATDTSGFGQKQSAYRIIVKQQHVIVWDSDWLKSPKIQLITYAGKPLRSDKTYHWTLLIKDEHNKISTGHAYWTTGLLKRTDWKAQWIGTDQLFNHKSPTNNIMDPFLRKDFSLTNRPKRAMLYVASIGYHEVYVNGQKMGNDVLSPAVTDHSKRARYVTYDIASGLRSGKNTILIWLGTSWSIFAPYVRPDRLPTPMVLAQADVDGQILTTDSTWVTRNSPNKLLGYWDARNFGGECYDARMEADTGNWKPAVVYHHRLLLSAQQCEPNRLMDTIRPTNIESRADGSYRVDMGVNFAGWTQIKVKGSPGDSIRFEFSERQHKDMTFGLHNIYVIGQNGYGTFQNHFNYSSGRWITIKGLKYKPELSDITGWLVRTNYQAASTFSCSDSLQNWLYKTINWTFENLSLGGYTVDCPQRERMGYGGDAHATSEIGVTNYRLGAFYTKWLEDWRDVQGSEPVVGDMYDTTFARKKIMSGRHLDHGILPHTAPTYEGGGGPGWGGIVVTLPWLVYQHEGDTRILENNFQMIKNWLRFLDSHTNNNMLVRWGGDWDFLGDWLWPGTDKGGMMTNDKPSALFFNNCYRVYNLRTAIKIAKVLHHDDDAKKWQLEADRASVAIHANYYNASDHSYCDSSMVNLAAALLARVVPEKLRPLVMQRLETEIINNQHGHIFAGIGGGAILFKLLREEGRSDLIYSMTSQTGYPGWGYMKGKGATTIWEAWEGETEGYSLLHSSYLYPGAWYVNEVAGIKPDPASPGFQHFILQPLSGTNFSWAQATLQSPAGLIKLSWKREGHKLLVDFTVPPNSTASLRIKGYRPEEKIPGTYHLTFDSL